jgi:translation initiation factor IF-3
VLVIIESDSKSLGVMGLAEAMTEARKRGLDLVEVNPTANPPVCKILDFGKYRYNLSKKEKDTPRNSCGRA